MFIQSRMASSESHNIRTHALSVNNNQV